MTSGVGVRVPAGGGRSQPNTEGWDFPSSRRCHDERICFSSVEENTALGSSWFHPRGRLRSARALLNLSDMDFPRRSLNKN